MINPALIWELTKRDFTERFAGSILGSLWAIIWPMVNLAIYIIIFGKVMGGRLPGRSEIFGYSIYVACGLIPWVAFSTSIARCTSVFLDKRHIISKMRVSLPSLLVYVILSETITYVVSMGLFFIFLFYNDFHLNQRLILLPFIYYLQQLFAFGGGLLAASLSVFIRDVKEVTNVFLQLWFWFTPIVYVRQILPDIVNRLMVYNPAYIFIESYQRIFLFNDEPPTDMLITLCVATHLLIIGSYFLFRHLEKDIRDCL
jgi:lipopolysaccharide transport system permease protein